MALALQRRAFLLAERAYSKSAAHPAAWSNFAHRATDSAASSVGQRAWEQWNSFLVLTLDRRPPSNYRSEPCRFWALFAGLSKSGNPSRWAHTREELGEFLWNTSVEVENMTCPSCGAEVSEDSRFCNKCAYALTEDAKQWVASMGNGAPALNPNTFGGYMQSDAGKNAVNEIVAILNAWVAEANRGFRWTLTVFAIILGVLVTATVVMSITNNLTASAGTVLGLLIGVVVGKFPGPGGGGSKSQSQ